MGARIVPAGPGPCGHRVPTRAGKGDLGASEWPGQLSILSSLIALLSST